MSDYIIILGYGCALLGALLAIARNEKIGGASRTFSVRDCVEVRR